MRTAEDLTGGIKMYDEYDCDSLIAVYEDVKANGFNYYRMGENNAGIAEHREHNTGIRRQDMNRYVLRRELETVDTAYGPVRVKRASGLGVDRAKPEFEDIAELARKNDLPLGVIREAVSHLK
jgi:hypothetical protein